METKHNMLVWAPSDEELAQIDRQVSKERAAAVQSVFTVIREWATRKVEPQIAIRPHALKAPSYY